MSQEQTQFPGPEQQIPLETQQELAALYGPVPPLPGVYPVTERRPANNAEWRHQVETAVGQAVSYTFQKNAEHVVRDPETGAESLTLHVPFRDKEHATVTAVQQVSAEDGGRTVDLSFASKSAWANYWRYTDGPNQEPHLVPCSRDESTGQLVPKTAPQPRPDGYVPHDPTSDYEVAYWGKMWPKNLAEGSPERPRVGKFKAFMGRVGTRGARA